MRQLSNSALLRPNDPFVGNVFQELLTPASQNDFIKLHGQDIRALNKADFASKED